MTGFGHTLLALSFPFFGSYCHCIPPSLHSTQWLNIQVGFVVVMSTTFSPTKESGSIDITVQNTRASQEDIPANRSIDKEGQGGTLSTRTVHGLSVSL